MERIKALRNGKAIGISDVSNEMLKYAIDKEKTHETNPI